MDAFDADVLIYAAVPGHERPMPSTLATAVGSGAERFVTNNRRDFRRSIEEVEITYPEDLPDP